MSPKKITGGIITLIIGGTAFTVSQSDIVQNFADDTGMTQEQAEQYVGSVSEDELFSFDEIGSDLVTEGRGLLKAAAETDCENYDYEWQSASLPCREGKTQLEKLGRDTLALGEAYGKLESDSASEDDIRETVRLIDQVNADYNLAIIRAALDAATIDESKKTNSYNKAVLQAALESR